MGSASIVASVGVYKLKTWARNPYVVLCILDAVVFSLLGPMVETPIAGGLAYLGNISIGITIGLLLISPARRAFEPVSSSQVGGHEIH